MMTKSCGKAELKDYLPEETVTGHNQKKNLGAGVPPVQVVRSAIPVPATVIYIYQSFIILVDWYSAELCLFLF